MKRVGADQADRERRALVIEDDGAIRGAIAGALRGAGFDVVEAADGVSGLRAVVDHLLSLDLVVTDVEMPGMNGEALIRTVRKLGGETDLPILVVTGSIPASRGPSLRAAGVDAFVLKSEGLEAVTSAARELVDARAPAADDEDDDKTPIVPRPLRPAS